MRVLAMRTAVSFHLRTAWFIADLVREAVSDRIHRRTPTWPS